MSEVPAPGKPVRGSRSGRPVMALFDLLGRNWAMGVMWTLCRHGPCTFRELQTHCESVSPAVLNSRLKELRQSNLVESGVGGYRATAIGQSLYRVLAPLDPWSKKWAKSLANADTP
jgi:DNA-binding HxlR family transcriptional regulator